MIPILGVKDDIERDLLPGRLLQPRLAVVRLPQHVVFFEPLLDFEFRIGLTEMGERPALVACVNAHQLAKHLHTDRRESVRGEVISKVEVEGG